MEILYHCCAGLDVLKKMDGIRELGDRLVILDRREKPEAVHAELVRLAESAPFALIVADTLAAFFDGDNINDAVQGGQFMRRLRPLTQVGGNTGGVAQSQPNIVFNITTPNSDSFQASQSQIYAKAGAALSRTAQRNGGSR